MKPLKLLPMHLSQSVSRGSQGGRVVCVEIEGLAKRQDFLQPLRGGNAGRHVGQEADLFATYKFHQFLFGAGGGYLFKGEFIHNTTPGAGPGYMYVFQTYSF